MEEKTQTPTPEISRLMEDINGLSEEVRIHKAVNKATKPMSPHQRETFAERFTRK